MSVVDIDTMVRMSTGRYIADKHDELQGKLDDISKSLLRLADNLDDVQVKLDKLSESVQKDLDEVLAMKRKLNHKQVEE